MGLRRDYDDDDYDDDDDPRDRPSRRGRGRSIECPRKVQAIAIMTLIGGIWACTSALVAIVVLALYAIPLGIFTLGGHRARRATHCCEDI